MNNHMDMRKVLGSPFYAARTTLGTARVHHVSYNCHLFEVGLVVRTPPATKTASSTPAILGGPEGVRCMGG